MGKPWTGDYVFASGDLVEDLTHNFFLETGARNNKLKVYEMVDHPAARALTGYLLVRGGVHQVAYARAVEKLTGADLMKMFPARGSRPTRSPSAGRTSSAASTCKLYRFSPEDYQEIVAVFNGPHPETGEDLEVVDHAPEGVPPVDLPPETDVFAPDYAPEEIAEIAREAARGGRAAEGADRRRRQQRRQRQRRREVKKARSPDARPGRAGENGGMSPLLPPLADPTDKEAIRFGERALTLPRSCATWRPRWPARLGGRSRGGLGGARLETCVGRRRRAVAGVPVGPDQPQGGRARARRTSSPTARPALVLAPPGAELPPRSATLERDRRRRSSAARDELPPGRARPRGAGARRLHVGHDRAAQGRRSCRAARSPRTSTRSPRVGSGPPTTCSLTALPLFHVHGLVLGVLGAAAARRHRPPPRVVLDSTAVAARARAAARRCCSASRRCTTAWPTRPRRDGDRRRLRWDARGCSCRARRHCRPPTTSGSSAPAASAWSSATG